MTQVVVLRFCTKTDFTPGQLEYVRKALEFAIEDDNYDPATGVEIQAIPVGDTAKDRLDLLVAHRESCDHCGDKCQMATTLQARYEAALLEEMPTQEVEIWCDSRRAMPWRVELRTYVGGQLIPERSKLLAGPFVKPLSAQIAMRRVTGRAA